MTAFLYNHKGFAQTINAVSATFTRFQVPILKEKTSNPVFQLTIEIPDTEKPFILTGIELALSGTELLYDINEVKIFFTGDKANFNEGPSFSDKQKPGN